MKHTLLCYSPCLHLCGGALVSSGSYGMTVLKVGLKSVELHVQK